MKAKNKRRTALLPLAEAIAKDARNKKALNKQFWSFYKQMRKAIRSNKELRHLEVPLERVKDSVTMAAWGRFFGIPLVPVTKHKD